MTEFFNSLGPIGDILLMILGALGILIVGYLIARIVASVVRRLLERVDFDNRLASWVSEGEEQRFDIEDLIAKVVFWVIMLFVVVAMLQQLNLPAVANPINALLQKITTEYLPSLGGAALLLVVAWLVATALRFLVTKTAGLFKLDERLSQHAALEEGERVSFSNSLATAVFWFVFLLFLPSVLARLGMSEIAAPVQQIFSRALGFLPNIFGAAIILLIGWFLARVIRQIITNLLAAVGVDRFGERVGLSGERSFSKIMGTIVYTFVLLFAVISALEELNIEAISQPATLMLNTIINAIPNIFGAAVVLAVSYFIGRLVSNLIADLLSGVGFDALPEKLGLKMAGGRTLSELTGYLILVGIMLFAAISAAELLGSASLSAILTAFIGFLGQLVMALIIFAIGLYLANLTRNIILSAGGESARFGATVARVAILVLAGAMGLRQLGVADDIVNMAFGIMLGALGVAAALAFGLGSREVAGREVEKLLDSVRAPDRENG